MQPRAPHPLQNPHLALTAMQAQAPQRQRITLGPKMPPTMTNGSTIIWCAMNVINLIACIFVN